MAVCEHFREAKPQGSAHTAFAGGCPECKAMGDTWVHLRQCLVCGHVGCCDSSRNKHATKHFHHAGHPVIRSVQPGEHWGWCYVDEVMAETVAEQV